MPPAPTPVYENLDAPPAFSGVGLSAPAAPPPPNFQLPPGAVNVGSGNYPAQPVPQQPAPQPSAPPVAPPAAAPAPAPSQPQPAAPVQPPRPPDFDGGQPFPHYAFAPAQPAGQTPGQLPPAPVTPPEPQARDPRELLAEFGYDVSRFGPDVDDEAILRHVVQQARMAEQYRAMDPYIRLGQEVTNDAEAWREFQRSRQARSPGQPSTASPPAPAAPAAGGPPALDPVARQWLDALQNEELTDEQKGQMPVGVATQIRNWNRWRAERANRVVEDPFGLIKDQAQQEFDQRYVTTEKLEKAFQEWQNRLYAQAVQQQHEEAWYAHDPATKERLVDPATGQYLLTPYGAQWTQADQTLLGMGVQDPAHRVMLLKKLLPAPANGQSAPNGAAAAQAAAPVPQPAPYPPSAPPQTPQQAFVDVASQMHAQYPPYPPVQRGGAVGQPPGYLNPADLAPPRLSDVAQQLHGAQAQW